MFNDDLYTTTSAVGQQHQVLILNGEFAACHFHIFIRTCIAAAAKSLVCIVKQYFASAYIKLLTVDQCQRPDVYCI